MSRRQTIMSYLIQSSLQLLLQFGHMVELVLGGLEILLRFLVGLLKALLLLVEFANVLVLLSHLFIQGADLVLLGLLLLLSLI